MRFASATMLWWLAALPAAALLGVWAWRRRRALLARYAGGPAHLARFDTDLSPHRRAVKLLLVLAALAGTVLALARPQWGARLEPIERAGIDVMIVLDTSLSMAAEDVAPSRLAQARREIDSLVGLLAGDRVGLVSFAGEAVRSCPLTVDYQAVRLFLDALDAEAVSVPGTALSDALKTAREGFTAAGDAERGRVIVLFTDGEDHGGGIDEEREALRRERIPVYVVGVGTDRGGPIPLRDGRGRLSGYKKDGEGRIVTTRLDEVVLRDLSIDTGGRYYRATPSEEEVGEIAQALSGMDAREIGTQLRRRYEERFQYPLALAWLALLAETWLGERRRRRP